MKEYIDEMLHLTADIAEELLTLKDSGQDIDEELCRKIRRLSFIADSNHACAPDDRIEEVTDTIIRDSAIEMTAETAPQPSTGAEYEVENLQGDSLIDQARREARMSEDDESEVHANTPLQSNLPEDIDTTTCNTYENETAPRAEAETAEFEESADADVTPSFSSALTASQLRNALTLNDMFLYRRSLFGGSAERFNKALAHMATLHTVDEVKDYLSTTLHINLKTDEAKDFLSSICQFFNE